MMDKVNSSFLWGAATSAHQVEGDNIHNDWWHWEQNHKEFPKSNKACDHYNRFKDDFALAESLSHNAHRFSLEWSRIEIEQGKFNQKAIKHYREVLLELRKLGLKSFVTLHHFTNPQWLVEQGGWENKKTPYLFSRYAEEMANQLGDLVDFWITINEPMVYAVMSFFSGQWVPRKKSLLAMKRVVRNMIDGHQQAYRSIHDVISEAQVGIAKNRVAYVPSRVNSLLDKTVVGWQDWWFNHYFMNRTIGSHDFLGVNYYFQKKTRVSILPPSVRCDRWPGDYSDLNWAIRPQGLEQVLLDMKKYKLPIYVTENGLADANDHKRAKFIRSHLRAVERAQRQGADVRGYLHWSLLDNFEWAEGFSPRFGLVEVNYRTFERRVRSSAYAYKAIIDSAKNSLYS